MSTLLAVLVLAFVMSALLTPLARALAVRFRLVDHPDGRRKMQERPVALAGGVAVWLAMAGSLAVAMLSVTGVERTFAPDRAHLHVLLLASAVICVIGLADDIWGLRGRHKLLGQILVSGIVVASGVVVRNVQFFSWRFELGLVAIPFTLFWLLGAINAINLLDGMDGVATCVGSIICLAMATMAALTQQWAAAFVGVALAGALIGFLCYNFPPATIFLGDSGSMLVGLVIGVLAIDSSLKGPATAALAAPLAALTLPILDTSAAIIRRKLTGRSIYMPDRGHLHHCLMRRGLSNRRVLAWVSLFCLVTAEGAVATLAFRNELFAILSVVTVAAVLVVTRLFGHAELLLVRNRLVSAAKSFLVTPSDGKAHETQVHLQGSADWQRLWCTLVAEAERLNLAAVHLDVNAPAIQEGFHARWDRSEGESQAGTWCATVPLIAEGRTVGRLEVVGVRDAGPLWSRIVEVSLALEKFDAGVSALVASRPQAPLAPPKPPQALRPLPQLELGSGEVSLTG